MPASRLPARAIADEHALRARDGGPVGTPGGLLGSGGGACLVPAPGAGSERGALKAALSPPLAPGALAPRIARRGEPEAHQPGRALPSGNLARCACPPAQRNAEQGQTPNAT